MKHKFLILSILTFSANITFSQTSKDISAGVIDFLLRNPKTANKMNVAESTALDIIGDLLKTASERKHQLEYAAAGSNQITVNSSDGRQAQFVKNEQGKIFLLVDGVVYPIAQELVEEAKTMNSKNSSASIYREKEYKEDIYEGNYDYRTTLIPNVGIDIKLRVEPDVSSVHRYIILNEDIIYVLDRSNKLYYKVYVKGYTGYVRSSYLKRQE